AAAKARGLTWRIGKRRGVRVRLSYAKVAELQHRGAVHFHALIRLDGYDPTDPVSIVAPDKSVTPALLASIIEDAVKATRFTTRPHPRNRHGWPIEWGKQIDVRTVRLNGSDIADDGQITTTAVAGYLAKYATK